MKVRPIRDYKWSVNFETVKFNKSVDSDVPDNIGKSMIGNGYAINPYEIKIKEITPPSKESLVSENKAIIPDQTKTPSIKRKGRKNKS